MFENNLVTSHLAGWETDEEHDLILGILFLYLFENPKKNTDWYILRADLLGLHYYIHNFLSILEMIVSKFMFTIRSKFTIETCRLFSLALLGIFLPSYIYVMMRHNSWQL